MACSGCDTGADCDSGLVCAWWDDDLLCLPGAGAYVCSEIGLDTATDYCFPHDSCEQWLFETGGVPPGAAAQPGACPELYGCTDGVCLRNDLRYNATTGCGDSCPDFAQLDGVQYPLSCITDNIQDGCAITCAL